MTESPYNSDSDIRYCKLIQWLQETGTDYLKVEPASADASFRRYFRVFKANESLIAVDSPSEHNNNLQFIDLAARLLGSGIRTPEVICYSLEKGFLLLEDFGTQVLQQKLKTATEVQTNLLYTEAINCIGTLQKAPTNGLPLYNKQFLTNEMQLFIDWYLKRHLAHEPNRSELDIINDVFKLCADNASEQPQVFVHRDYHCRNLMPLTDGTLGVIDFQDAVIGPVTYDPVSLLKDAYIDWPAEFISQFSNQHRQSLSPVPDQAQYNRWFDLMGLQRHIKVLGIFCRLNYRDSKSQYFKDLPLVLQHIERTTAKYPELENFRCVLKNTRKKAATLS